VRPLAEALDTLPADRRDIILLAYFLAGKYNKRILKDGADLWLIEADAEKPKDGRYKKFKLLEDKND